MSRPAGYIPQHCHHKPSGQGYVRLNGRAIYTGEWGSEASRQRYDALIAEWVAGGRKAFDEAPSAELLVEDLLAKYWEHAEKWYVRSDGTASDELRNIRYALKPLRALYAHLPVAEFKPRHLKVFREQWIKKGVCRNVVNKQVMILRRAFSWGVEDELVPAEVAFALEKVRHLPFGRGGARESQRVHGVDEADMQAVLPHVSRQVAAMIQLQWLTGMRPGEVVLMRTGDIDRSAAVWVYSPARHKTAHLGKERFIPIGPKGQEIVSPFLELDRSLYLFRPAESDAEHRATLARERVSAVTPSQARRHKTAMTNPKRSFNERYSVASYGRAIRRACEAAQVDPWSPNQLRHSAATRLRRLYGIEAAQAVLGHASLRTTEIYAEKDHAVAMSAMESSG